MPNNNFSIWWWRNHVLESIFDKFIYLVLKFSDVVLKFSDEQDDVPRYRVGIMSDWFEEHEVLVA